MDTLSVLPDTKAASCVRPARTCNVAVRPRAAMLNCLTFTH